MAKEDPTLKMTQVRDRVSRHAVYLFHRDGVVVGAVGSDPKRFMGLTLDVATKLAGPQRGRRKGAR